MPAFRKVILNTIFQFYPERMLGLNVSLLGRFSLVFSTYISCGKNLLSYLLTPCPVKGEIVVNILLLKLAPILTLRG